MTFIIGWDTLARVLGDVDGDQLFLFVFFHYELDPHSLQRRPL